MRLQEPLIKRAAIQNVKSFDFDVIYDELISGCSYFDDDEVDMIFSALKKVYMPKKVTNNGYGVHFCPVCCGSVWQNREEINLRSSADKIPKSHKERQ